MPIISSFYGIMVVMYRSDHNPPHFHARYAEHEIEMNIRDGAWRGRMPPRAVTMLQQWRKRHIQELLEDWQRALGDSPLLRIGPLE
jgi:hypothetical protein